MATVKNPQEKSINQKRGPTTGNGGQTEKRRTFIEEKSGGWREQMADTVMSALETRGRGVKPYVDPAVEGLHSDTGPKSNPTAGGTKYNVKTRAPGKIPK